MNSHRLRRVPGPRASLPLSVLLLSALLAPGCASANWLGDRARDFAQIFDADVSVGTGIRAYAGVSHVAQFGLGWTKGTHAGLRDGTPASWQEERSELGLGPFFLDEVDLSGGSALLVGHRTARFGETGYVEHPLEISSATATDRRPLDVGVGFHLLFFGASVEFRAAEFLDFLGGLVGLDPSADDLSGRTLPDLLVDLESADPIRRRNADRALRLLSGRDSPYRTYSAPDVVTAEQREAVEIWRRYLEERGLGPAQKAETAPAGR